MSESFVELAPLINFDSDVKLLELSEGLCLRRAEDEEIGNLVDLFVL